MEQRTALTTISLETPGAPAGATKVTSRSQQYQAKVFAAFNKSQFGLIPTEQFN